MRIGIVLLPQDRWPEAKRRWQRAEEYGFDHAWTYDHLSWRSLVDEPWFATVPLLAAAAAVTERPAPRNSLWPRAPSTSPSKLASDCSDRPRPDCLAFRWASACSPNPSWRGWPFERCVSVPRSQLRFCRSLVLP